MTDKILFVDDDVNLLEGYKRQLRRQFRIATAIGGEAGLELIDREGPFSVVVSDMRMPQMDGTKFLTEVRSRTPDTVRMLLTGQADLEDAIAVVNQGQIFRFLTKPCEPAVLTKALDDGLQQFRLVTAEQELLNDTLKGAIKLLVEIVSIISPDTFSRSIRLRDLATKIAVRIGVQELWEVDVAALLSQIGTVTVPSEVRKKKVDGETLSQREEQIYLKHIRVGRDLVSNIPRLEEVAEAIAFQEKGFDGSGVPNSAKKAKSIPTIARILKIVLDFDEMVTAGKSRQNALSAMNEIKQRYDPDLLAALEAEILEAHQGFVVREISPEQIRVGMVLAEDLKTKTNQLLVPKQREISAALKTCILRFVEKDNIVTPVRILERVQPQIVTDEDLVTKEESHSEIGQTTS